MRKIKEWISDIDWKYIGFCLLLFAGLCVVATIHYFLFTKPVEDRVNAEWQEKYDEMVGSYEDRIYDMEKEWLDWYDKGYREGYDEGYIEGINHGE